MTPAPPENRISLLTALKEVSFFVAIYLYFTGFIYIYYFFDSFGISIRSVDTPVYYFFVYSYNVLTGIQEVSWGAVLKQRPLWTSIGVIVVVAAILVFLRRTRSKQIILMAALVVLFPIVFSLARATAKNDALGIRTGLSAKEITFVLKKEASGQTSPQLVRSLLPPLVDDETKPKQKKKQSPANSTTAPETQSASDRCVDNQIEKYIQAQVTPTPQDAEVIALIRFLSANTRTDLCAETGSSPEVKSYWPKLYLVTETSDYYYVILQPYVVRNEDKENETYDYGAGYVYRISKSDVLVAEVKTPQPE
jgi:hypothetical protein